MQNKTFGIYKRTVKKLEVFNCAIKMYLSFSQKTGQKSVPLNVGWADVKVVFRIVYSSQKSLLFKLALILYCQNCQKTFCLPKLCEAMTRQK